MLERTPTRGCCSPAMSPMSAATSPARAPTPSPAPSPRSYGSSIDAESYESSARTPPHEGRFGSLHTQGQFLSSVRPEQASCPGLLLPQSGRAWPDWAKVVMSSNAYPITVTLRPRADARVALLHVTGVARP